MAELLDSLGKGLAHALPLNILGKIPLMRSLSHSLLNRDQLIIKFFNLLLHSYGVYIS